MTVEVNRIDPHYPFNSMDDDETVYTDQCYFCDSEDVEPNGVCKDCKDCINAELEAQERDRVRWEAYYNE